MVVFTVTVCISLQIYTRMILCRLFQGLEYRSRLETLAKQLLKIADSLSEPTAVTAAGDECLGTREPSDLSTSSLKTEEAGETKVAQSIVSHEPKEAWTGTEELVHNPEDPAK